MTLREMRRLRKISQASLAKTLKIGQEGVSRIERRKDMNISTLVSYIEGIGGKLSFVVDMPGQPPFVMAGLGSKTNKKKSRKNAGFGGKSKAESQPAV
jgi:transcriptional regulator with XRE-family HTH domain